MSTEGESWEPIGVRHAAALRQYGQPSAWAVEPTEELHRVLTRAPYDERGLDTLHRVLLREATLSGSRPEESVRSAFERLTKWWVGETAFSSSVSEIYLHRAYHQILGLGPRALPLIFDNFVAHPARWMPALEAVARADPAEEAESIEEAVHAWIGWARSQGLGED